MEIIFEILFELYLELMMYIVPEEKATSKGYRALCIIFATVVLLGTFALFIWGCVLISEYDNKLGAIPITAAVVISLAQIILGLILHDKKS